ncbi:MAG: LPS assembly lipoprotein LptE [Candidatus Binatia bacterium]|jgi:hypothetical protein
MRFTAVLLAVAFVGCGYHFAGEQIGLPADIHSLSVGKLVNRSREHGLEKTLAFALEREIHERGHFRMIEDPGGGDAVLSGTIRALRVRPVAFDANDIALQYEITLILDLTLTRKDDGKVLWHVKGLQESDQYSASPNVVVTTSPQFQQSGLNASNVLNPEFTAIQLTETERRSAITRMLGQAVRDVYNQMIENF